MDFYHDFLPPYVGIKATLIQANPLAIILTIDVSFLPNLINVKTKNSLFLKNASNKVKYSVKLKVLRKKLQQSRTQNYYKICEQDCFHARQALKCIKKTTHLSHRRLQSSAFGSTQLYGYLYLDENHLIGNPTTNTLKTFTNIILLYYYVTWTFNV